MLMVWIIGLLALEFDIFLLVLYLRKMQRKPIDNNFSWYYYRGHKLSSIAINFIAIDSIWQKLLYYQDVMIFCVAFSVSLRDQTRLVSNPCLLFSGEKRRSVEDFRDWIVCSIALLGEKGRERPICIDGRYSNSSRLADSYSPN